MDHQLLGLRRTCVDGVCWSPSNSEHLRNMDDLYHSLQALETVASSSISEMVYKLPALPSPNAINHCPRPSVPEQKTQKSRRKRRSSDSQPRRQRAAIACSCCRSRKVRCDVVRTVPCTNCCLDKQECVIPPNRKKR